MARTQINRIRSSEMQAYENYRINVEHAAELERLCAVAFALTQVLLSQRSTSELEGILRDRRLPLAGKPSYTRADIKVDHIEMVGGWLTVEEYAEKAGRPTEDIAKEAEQGLLGEVAQKNGRRLLLWPVRGRKTPEVGKKLFSLAVSRSAIASLEVTDDDPAEAQDTLLALTNALGDPDQVTARASTLLRETLFLMRWNSFESFLRAALRELYRADLSVLARGKPGSTSKTFNEIYEQSHGLSSIEALRESLITAEIEKAEGALSVHGLINSLNSDFKLAPNPYDAPYTLEGDKCTCSYNKLLEIKAVRNALVHQGGVVDDEFLQRFPLVPHDGLVVCLNERYCLESRLVLEAIAHAVNLATEKRRESAPISRSKKPGPPREV